MHIMRQASSEARIIANALSIAPGFLSLFAMMRCITAQDS